MCCIPCGESGHLRAAKPGRRSCDSRANGRTCEGLQSGQHCDSCLPPCRPRRPAEGGGASEVRAAIRSSIAVHAESAPSFAPFQPTRRATAATFSESLTQLSPDAANASVEKYHPDVADGSDAHQNFVRLNEAYSVLSRTSARRDYDRTRSPFSQAGQPFRSSEPGRSDEMYQQWYRNVYSQRRRPWTPQDDFGPPTPASKDSMRRAVFIITGLVGLALVFQAFIMSRNQEKQRQRLVEERRMWAVEIQRMAEGKEKKTKKGGGETEGEKKAKDSEEAKKG